ncbi:MAG: sugar O-acetyltransferase [Oscillospiraceae bacterium]|nr:sugar O-acetyltransferase [Oscillospiraceae bacterium]
MTEFEKCQAGLMYDTTFPGREEDHLRCADLCYDYNHTRPSDTKRREELIRQLFGKVGSEPYVEPNIFCGFGWNIEVGDHFFANNNCVFVDPGKITFGDYVFIGPSCGFYTAHHAIHKDLRQKLYEKALPITVGSHVWIGGGTVVTPGTKIGSNVVIGAGSVVVHDIPDNCVAFGNPCKPYRAITEEDLEKMR